MTNHGGRVSWLLRGSPPPIQPQQPHALTRVQTSVGSLVVPAPPTHTITDLIKDANKLLAKHFPETPHSIVAFVTVDGDLIDPTLVASLATERNQELVGLSEAERNLLPPRVHPFFSNLGKKQDMVVVGNGAAGRTFQRDDSKQLSFLVPRTQGDGDDDDVRSSAPTMPPSIGPVDRGSLSIFLSYCWTNSKLAVGDKSVGPCDPREVHQYLGSQGFSDIWIDTERMTTGDDLFDKIAEGLMSCDLVIVCVSDDYALSKNCLRELNFAVNSMKLPIVTLVVGEGFNWQKSKVGLMLGDQVYLDATKADNISSRMESLVSALDRSISNNNLQDRLSISEEPDTIPDASLYTQLDESFSPDNLLQDLREIDETFANLPQLNLVVGEKVEVLRWRFTRKSYHVGGGLHWVPVQIVEIGAPTNPYDPTSSRLIKVLFQARISYNKTKNGPLVMNVVDEDVEWIEEFLIRKPSEMPRNLPDLDIGDAVEFRQFVHRDKAKRSKEAYLANNGVGSDLGDLEEEEQDTYMFWPAFIVAKMANRKYLIRQSKGMGIMAEDGNYASALKLVSAKLLRIGHHPKMLRVRHALNQKYLIVLPKGSIVRPQYVPDIKEDQEPHLLLTGNKLMDQIGVIMLTPEPEEEYRGSKGHKTTRASIAKEQKSSKLPIPDPNLSLRDNFLRSSFILWKHATAGGFKVDPQKYAVLWLSHAFRTPRVEDTEGRLEMTPGYLAQVLAKRSVHVIDSGVEVGDFSELDEDEIKVKLFKGIVKASVFLALLTPEYLASDLHQKEIEYAKALHIPILYALVHNDKSKNPASVFANNALSYFKLLNSDSIIDFTVRPLIWSRIDTLVYRMNHQLKVINANRKQSRLKDEDVNNLPWMRNSLDVSSGTYLESLSCVLTDVDVVEVAGDDDQVVGTSQVSVCGLTWTLHRSVLSFSVENMNPRKSTAQTIVSPANVLSMTFSWIYQGDVDWDSSNSGRLSFKPTKHTRYVCEPDDVKIWSAGEMVEVRMHWVSGELGDQYLWWPAKIVKQLSPTEYLAVLHHSDTLPSSKLPLIKVTIAQIRNGRDPRTTKWYPPSRFYITDRILLGADMNEANDRLVIKQPNFRFGGEIMDNYSVACRSLEARERMKWKDNLRSSDAMRQAIHALSDKNDNMELKRMVTRLADDPHPGLWTEGVWVDDPGLVIKFDEWLPKCVTSKYSFLQKSTRAKWNYVEVEVVELGWSEDAGFACLSIGPISIHYPPFMMVGWAGRSIGYHSLNGRRVRSIEKSDLTVQGLPYGVGDIVGVGFDMNNNIFFTLNGQYLFNMSIGNAGTSWHLGISSDGPAILRVIPNALADERWFDMRDWNGTVASGE